MKGIGKVIKIIIVITLVVLFLKMSLNTIFDENEPLITQVHDEEVMDQERTELKDENKGDGEDENGEGFNRGLTADPNTDFAPIFTYEDIPEEIMNKMEGVSWQEEAPIGLEALSYLTVTYWDFSETEQRGELIVHKKVAEEMVEIFEELYEARFPIAKISLIDEYNGDDNLSMEDNNTYGFCFRVINETQRISKHGYGLAIDINPIQNPYIKGDTILPLEGKDYVNRGDVRKGMIIKGDVPYLAFTSRGWTWGGEWNTVKDYHHFQKEIDLDE